VYPLDEFLGHKENNFNFRSRKISHLIKLEYLDFLAVLKEFPDEYEKFCQIRDKINNYG
jgi:hypothetical protein